MGAIGAAAGQDLAGWTASWLDQAGTDTISLVGTTLLTSSPDGGEPRRHALRVGSYDRTDGGLEKRGDLHVQTTGTTTYLPDLPVRRPAPAQRRRPHLRLGAHRRVLAPGAARRGGPAARGGQPGGRGRDGMGHARQGRAVDAVTSSTACWSCWPPSRARVSWSRSSVSRCGPPSSGAPQSWSPAGWPGWPRSPPPGPTSPTTAPRRCTPWRGPPRSPSTSSCSTTRPRTTSTWPGGCMVRRASLGRYDEAAVAELLARDPDPDAHLRGVGRRGGAAARGGQGRGVGALLAGTVGAGRSADSCLRPLLLAAGPARPAGPVGAPLPRRGHQRLRWRAARPGRHGPPHAADDLRRGVAGPGRRARGQRGRAARRTHRAARSGWTR